MSKHTSAQIEEVLRDGIALRGETVREMLCDYADLLAEREKGEPVAEIVWHPFQESTLIARHAIQALPQAKDLQVGTKLYAHPPSPKGE